MVKWVRYEKLKSPSKNVMNAINTHKIYLRIKLQKKCFEPFGT